MAVSTRTISLSILPGELRVKVYEHILRDISDDPTPRKLRPYAGLILSSKKTKGEFEHEWAKAFNAFLANIVKGTIFRPLPIKRFHDAFHVRLLFSNGPYIPSAYGTLAKLSTKLSAFTLRPDHTFSSQPLDGTVQGFFNSALYRYLDWFRTDVLFAGARLAGFSCSFSSPRRARPKALLDYLTPQLTYTRKFRVARPGSTPRLFCLPQNIRQGIYDVIVQSCTTMEDLQEYRGFIESCTMASAGLETALLSKSRVAT